MTNNMTDQEPLDYTDERDLAMADIEVLPWTTAHLKCKCGHPWDDHRGLGCELCNCLA